MCRPVMSMLEVTCSLESISLSTPGEGCCLPQHHADCLRAAGHFFSKETDTIYSLIVFLWKKLSSEENIKEAEFIFGMCS